MNGGQPTGANIAGAILAGGRARRMGGGAKPFLDLGGKPLIARVRDALAPQCSVLVVSANAEADRFGAFGDAVLADAIADHAGPLAGVLAAMDWAAANRPQTEWLLSAAADTPFLPGNLGARCGAAAMGTGRNLALACSGGRVHFACGLWRIDLRERIRNLLVHESIRRAETIADRLGYATAIWPAGPPDPFFNINTPDDLARAAALLAGLERTHAACGDDVP